MRKHLALEFRPRLPSMATIAKQIIEQYETEFDFFMYVGDVTADLSENMKDLVSLNVRNLPQKLLVRPLT